MTDLVVARLGGNARLPADTPWPVWDGHGPLCHIGEVDLTALARCYLNAGIPLPSSGRLVAFYFDGTYDDFMGVVGTWYVESLAGARLLYVPEDAADVDERPTPEGVAVFDERTLNGRQVTTFRGRHRHMAQRRRYLPEHAALQEPPCGPTAVGPTRAAGKSIRSRRRTHRCSDCPPGRPSQPCARP